MEWFDVVDEQGIPTGEIVERSEAHAKGIRHRTAHMWVLRKNDGKVEALLQKRSMNKDSFPGQYDTSSAGHIQAGDEPLESALRELAEELGIHANQEDLVPAGHFDIRYELPFHGKLFKDNEYSYVYIYHGEVDETQLVLQKEEIESVQWFTFDEVYEACAKTPRDARFCVPMGGLDVIRGFLNNHPDFL